MGKINQTLFVCDKCGTQYVKENASYLYVVPPKWLRMEFDEGDNTENWYYFCELCSRDFLKTIREQLEAAVAQR